MRYVIIYGCLSGLLFCYRMKDELFWGMEIFGYNNMKVGIGK